MFNLTTILQASKLLHVPSIYVFIFLASITLGTWAWRYQRQSVDQATNKFRDELNVVLTPMYVHFQKLLLNKKTDDTAFKKLLEDHAGQITSPDLYESIVAWLIHGGSLDDVKKRFNTHYKTIYERVFKSIPPSE